MTEAAWESETSEAPPKKKGLPKWLFACGAGCLLMLVVGALGAFLAGKAIKDAVDPDKAWAELAEIVPYDEPRPSYGMFKIPFMNLVPGCEGMWTLMADDGQTSGVIMVFESGGDVTADQFFDPDENQIDFGGATGNMGLHDFEVGTIHVQGRDLRIGRFRSHPYEEISATEEDEEEGVMSEMKRAMRKAAARIELTPDGEAGLIIVLEYAKPGTLEFVSDEEIVEFLAPFHIGPDR